MTEVFRNHGCKRPFQIRLKIGRKPTGEWNLKTRSRGCLVFVEFVDKIGQIWGKFGQTFARKLGSALVTGALECQVESSCGGNGSVLRRAVNPRSRIYLGLMTS